MKSLANIIISFTNFSEEVFLSGSKFFTLTKNLNTVRTLIEMKQNLLQSFHYFCHVIKH